MEWSYVDEDTQDTPPGGDQIFQQGTLKGNFFMISHEADGTVSCLQKVKVFDYPNEDVCELGRRALRRQRAFTYREAQWKE